MIRVYDSIKEYRRHKELQLLEKAGKISGVMWQFPLVIQESFAYRGERIRGITYKADFKYTDTESGETNGLLGLLNRHVCTKISDHNAIWIDFPHCLK